jgi:phage N-6-adenine-methyltransferase
MFSSDSDEWPTPPKLYRELDARWHFTLDACAQPHNAKCRRFFTPEQDGLKQRWKGVVWLNPPYSKVGLWMSKARVEAAKGATVVCLVPARTDTKWWHADVEPIRQGKVAGGVTFLKGRVKFAGAKHGAPFPSAVIVYEPGTARGIPEQGYLDLGL